MDLRKYQVKIGESKINTMDIRNLCRVIDSALSINLLEKHVDYYEEKLKEYKIKRIFQMITLVASLILMTS